MRKRVMAVMALALAVVGAWGLFRWVGRGSHRARLLIAAKALREAHAGPGEDAAVAGRGRGDVVYVYTNRFNVDGAVYHCGFAVESVDLFLRDRGLLAITTNGIFVWVDRKRGAIPLGNGPALAWPPGL